MSAKETKLINDLHQTIKDLMVDLGDIFTEPTEQGDMALIDFFYNQMPKDKIMHHTIDTLVPWKKHITERNLRFFDQNRHLFDGLPEARVVYYTELIMSQRRLTDEDMDMFWKYLDTMIAYAETYQKVVKNAKEHGQ
jgi:hypothetical protein